ncbi:MAG: MutS-related protein [Spirochaetaceae bacterium]
MKSLLYPENDSSQSRSRLPEGAQEDLGLDVLASALSDVGLSEHHIAKILRELPADHETISHRRHVLIDLSKRPVLREALQQLLPKLRELTMFALSARDADAPLLQAVRRVGELELYVDCIEGLCDAFDESDRRDSAETLSEGLAALARYARSARAGEQFSALKDELPNMKEGLKKKQSVTVGINLDERFRPEEAALLSVNPARFEQSGFLGRFLESLDRSESYRVSSVLHRMPSSNESHERRIPLAPLFQDLDNVLRSLGRSLERRLRSFLSLETAPLSGVEQELSFYLGAHRLKRRLEESGLPTCFPEITSASARRLEAEDFYNIQLALRVLRRGGSGADVVTNRIALDSGTTVALITGANQGGKTTFVQGVGLLQVMAQTGLFVPAREAVISPVDTVLTHFPSSEAGNIETGRLSRELEELAGVFEEATGDSLILLNESLAGTNAAEAVVIAEEMLAALRRVGARILYATHLHELAEQLDELNQPADAGPLLTGMSAETKWDGKEVRRTYRIVPGSARGKSFARDVARRHGISYDQLIDKFRGRGVL